MCASFQPAGPGYHPVVRQFKRSSDRREAIVELFDIFVGFNTRLVEPFDVGRVKVAVVCHHLFGEAGHVCGEDLGCDQAIGAFYERVRPTDSDPGRAKRIDRLFDGILTPEATRARLRHLDYPGSGRRTTS